MDNAVILAAASSIARGIPSKRRQIWATTEASSFVNSKVGSAVLARSIKSCTDSDRESVSLDTDSDGTRKRTSPGILRISRLVAMTLAGGHVSKISGINFAVA